MLNSSLRPQISKESLLSTGSSTIEIHCSAATRESYIHTRNYSEESTVVLIDGVSTVLDDSVPLSPHMVSKLTQPSYSEFFDMEKMKLHSIRLRTDLNEIMNSFTSNVDEGIPVLRYSQELVRNDVKTTHQNSKKRTRKCQIL